MPLPPANLHHGSSCLRNHTCGRRPLTALATGNLSKGVVQETKKSEAYRYYAACQYVPRYNGDDCVCAQYECEREQRAERYKSGLKSRRSSILQES